MAKRNSHISSVLARRKGDYEKVASEEARLEAQREARRKEREEEAKRIALAQAATEVQEAAPSAPVDAVAESRWERMMNGGGKKKKKRKADDDAPRRSAPPAPSEPKERRAGDGISVDETNALRESLGLKPLKG
jgi:hypothetical protein